MASPTFDKPCASTLESGQTLDNPSSVGSEHPGTPSMAVNLAHGPVAVIGAGVSGLTAAYLLTRTHDVTLFEADGPPRRARAHPRRRCRDGRTAAVDSGFIVHNERTYPHLLRLFAELGVETRPTEMSMSVTCDGCGLVVRRRRAGCGGILAQPWRVADPRFLRMLAQVPRFHRARPARSSASDDSDPTWGEFLADGRLHRPLRPPLRAAARLLRLVLGDARRAGLPGAVPVPLPRPPRDAPGAPGRRRGAPSSAARATYVDGIAAQLRRRAPRRAVTAVTRHDDGVEVRTATAGQARSTGWSWPPTPTRRCACSPTPTAGGEGGPRAIGYSRNETWLHRDASVLPAGAPARASWNYRARLAAARGSPTSVVSATG